MEIKIKVKHLYFFDSFEDQQKTGYQKFSAASDIHDLSAFDIIFVDNSGRSLILNGNFKNADYPINVYALEGIE